MHIDHDNLDTWLQSVTSVAHHRYQAGDIAGLVCLIKKFAPLYTSYPTDPGRSAVESAAMTCILMLANSHADQLRFEDALQHCEDVYKLLQENRARFIALGKTPRPNSLVWCDLLGTMSRVKWKAPAKFENTIMPPGPMLQKYLEVDNQINDYLLENPYKDEQRNTTSYLRALNCGSLIARLAFRYFPDQLPMLLEFIKCSHGSVLENPADDYYWNLEISRIWCSETPDQELLEESLNQLETIIHKEWGDYIGSIAFSRAFPLEREFLLKNLPQTHSGFTVAR